METSSSEHESGREAKEMEQEFTLEEVYSTLMEIDGDKALEPDGYAIDH